jgi:hypothetical protein
MELLASDVQPLADLAAYECNNDLANFLIHIIQHPEVAEPKFVTRERVGSK